MRVLKTVLLMTVIVSFMTAGAFAGVDDKVGFVDLSRLFDEYHKTKAYDEVLQGKTKSFEDERQKKVEKIQEAQGKLALLKDEEKAKLEKEIEDLTAEVLEFDRQNKAELTKERNEKIREILLEIEKIVSDYAQKEKFTMILNDRVLIYGDKTQDVTEQILAILNVDSAEKK